MGADARLSSTARIMLTRAESSPEVARRGVARADLVTSACTSVTSGRRPSRVTVTQVPATSVVRPDRKSPLGSASPTMPMSDRSKQPTSSVGP